MRQPSSKRWSVSFVVALCVLMTVPALAVAQNEGEEAFQKGDFKNALKVWVHMVEMGDADGFYGLGKLYEIGRAVPQSFVKAHMYFNLAGSKGHEGAILKRNVIAAKMSRKDLSRSRRLAEEFGLSHRERTTPERISSVASRTTRLLPNAIRKFDVRNFNGAWEVRPILIDVICNAIEVRNFKVNDGKISGHWSISATGSGLTGDIKENGRVVFYGSGEWGVGIVFEGYFKEDNTAGGEIKLSGESGCLGTWTAVKK